MADLTNKQRVFIEEYLQCWNATEAARRAGYGGGDATLAVIGSRNIRNVKIRRRIRKRLAGKAMAADEVLVRLGEQAQSDLGDFLRDEAGPSGLLDIEKVQKAGLTHLIKRIAWTRQGVSVELYDAQRALELIGKAHGLFRERLDITSKGEQIKGYAQVSPDDWGDDSE